MNLLAYLTVIRLFLRFFSPQLPPPPTRGPRLSRERLIWFNSLPECARDGENDTRRNGAIILRNDAAKSAWGATRPRQTLETALTSRRPSVHRGSRSRGNVREAEADDNAT